MNQITDTARLDRQRAIAEAGQCQCTYCVAQRAKRLRCPDTRNESKCVGGTTGQQTASGERTISEERLPMPAQEQDSPFILPSETL